MRTSVAKAAMSARVMLVSEIEKSTFVIFVSLKRCVCRAASFWLALVITSTWSVSGLGVRRLANAPLEKNRHVKRDVIDDGTGVSAGHGMDRRVIEIQHHLRACQFLESAAPFAVSANGGSSNEITDPFGTDFLSHVGVSVRGEIMQEEQGSDAKWSSRWA